MSFRRLAETERRTITFEVDGHAVAALEGDTYLTAIRLAGLALRRSEFGDGPRAGFCLMGACQDCWIWTTDGERLRACSTAVEAGVRLQTAPDAGTWPCPIS